MSVCDKALFRAWHPLVLGVLFLVAVIVLAVVHKQHSQSSILVIMAGAYGSLILLAPLTLAKLLDRSIRPGFANAAIVVGLVGAGVGTFWPFEVPDNVKLVLPIYTALIPAAILTWLGCTGSRATTQR